MNVLLLDNGHGADTAGKRSPLGLVEPQIFEWKKTREIVQRLYYEYLNKSNFVVKKITPENDDISLAERVKRVNKIVKDYPSANIALISVHLNAAEDPRATGWECFTSPGHTKADDFATILCNKANAVLSFKVRTDMSDGDPDKEAHFYILKHTICPAVLTENLFMTNPKDASFLNTEQGVASIVKLHKLAIDEYFQV